MEYEVKTGGWWSPHGTGSLSKGKGNKQRKDSKSNYKVPGKGYMNSV